MRNCRADRHGQIENVLLLGSFPGIALTLAPQGSLGLFLFLLVHGDDIATDLNSSAANQGEKTEEDEDLPPGYRPGHWRPQTISDIALAGMGLVHIGNSNTPAESSDEPSDKKEEGKNEE